MGIWTASAIALGAAAWVGIGNLEPFREVFTALTAATGSAIGFYFGAESQRRR